ncbi:glycine betaine ABC transporter substrate-binding protein [Aquibacillus saliphilus]|uniref:glycine betaine ABC transporter substrate-binding protein n=1 Tax=Aquibacillus saliphilus TaxID=1909422 RepID=UPI001CF0986B|nr:glycine betaine ABC transporter substrate-binding protein [Aquibacillus saliphilus]
MRNKRLNRIGIITGLSFGIFISGCGTDENEEENNQAEQTNFGEEMNFTITGIEPGAGVTQATEQVLEDYENLEDWEFETASTAAMLTALGDAYDKEEPIVVTGWSPHWIFAEWDLKYLEDPKGIYGDVEYISTIVRQELKSDMPEAYEILDRFHWESEDMEEVMLAAQEIEFEEAAKNWIKDNKDTVSEWTEGLQQVDGQSIELVLTPWDTERSSAHVMSQVLHNQGYEVTLTPVDPSVMIQAVATGDADASLAPWLPRTHGDFYDAYEGEFEDLGENLKGAKIGLVVPKYMDIESIEDLEEKK